MLRKLAMTLALSLPFAHAKDAEPIPVTHAVLVHGIWQNGGRGFGCLRRDLESRGVVCLAPSLRPATAHHGLTPLAGQLKAQIDRELAPGQRFVLISFSMGGLISRLYLQDFDGAARCDAFITISTPHHGTRMARMHPGRGAAEMRPDSVFLAELELGADRLGSLPIVSYRTPMDLVIRPTESSIWDRAENVAIPCPLHPLMTSFPALRKDLLRRFSYPAR